MFKHPSITAATVNPSTCRLSSSTTMILVMPQESGSEGTQPWGETRAKEYRAHPRKMS